MGSCSVTCHLTQVNESWSQGIDLSTKEGSASEKQNAKLHWVVGYVDLLRRFTCFETATYLNTIH